MKNIQQHSYGTTPEMRASIKGHVPILIWFTGLSGSGKSTLADALEQRLISKGMHAFHLDGDALRFGLNSDLGFTEADRNENLRRVAEVAALMLDAGLIVIGAFVSPLHSQRELLRQKVGDYRFMEVYVNTPIDVCELRDVKGYYAKARRGEIANFTGISAPYEPPQHPDLVLNTADVSIGDAMQLIASALRKKGIVMD